ncbi:MAG TPA: aldo/keto reductase [Thermoplasmata archaeon]|nr:aldo/keto reductase [Thermoplasmata archaeon]
MDSSSVDPGHFRPAPGGLTVSSLGVGTYIGAPDAATDRAVESAIGEVLATGTVNVLDTAINYRYQRAERSLGRALHTAVEAGRVQRDEMFVATKAGYFAPDAESSIPADQWVERELVAKGILDAADIVDGSHAMSVSYLKDQFERSRRNLGLDEIDLLYLHNAADAQLPVVGAEEFERRLAKAFGLLEELRDRGQLGAYGLATWDCFRSRRTDPGHLELTLLLRVAREVGGDEHGFRFVQFPFNFAMREAATLENQSVNGGRVTLLDAARQLGIGCFTSVPLLQGQLARRGPTGDGLSAAQTAIQFARSAPGNLAPLVGQKTPEHVEENLELARRSPWTREQFAELL